MAQISAPAAAIHPLTPPRHAGLFRQFLSELNPLQYLPVIGTIYRAVTHDTIPETAREAGSLVVSFLTGGPIGVAINIGALAAEKAAGIDPEALGDKVLAGIGIGSVPAQNAGTATVTVTELSPTLAAQRAAAGSRHGWSAAQLAAYGVTRNVDNELRRGSLQGSDVLNDLELSAHNSPTLA